MNYFWVSTLLVSKLILTFHSVSYLKGFVAAKKSDVLTFTSFTAHNHVTSRLQLFSHVWPIHCWQDRYFILDRLCHLIL